jgi:hypothetical protein
MAQKAPSADMPPVNETRVPNCVKDQGKYRRNYRKLCHFWKIMQKTPEK